MKLKNGPHKEDIKAAVHKKGSALSKLSLGAGLASTTCNHALVKPIPRANKAIASFLGESLHDLWPRWYNASGERIRIQSKAKSSRKRTLRHCKKSKGKLA